jgi:Ni/Co efflux regulator RcnB
MKFAVLKLNCAMALVVAGIFAAAPALADKPAGKGKGKEEQVDRRDEQKSERHDEQKGERREYDKKSRAGGDDRSAAQRRHFEDQHRVAVREYYTEQFRGGRCPPGLAKKNNGCMPPGQAKKWQMGRPLPRDVVYYQVPQELVARIGPPPSGYRYVRVASDILMIAIATGLVVDAIDDLGR